MSFIHRFLLSGLFAIGCIFVCAETSLTVSAQQQTSSLPVWKEADGKYTLCDKDGTLLSSKAYDYHGEWTDNITWVGLDQKVGMINQKGEEIIPLNYEHVLLNFNKDCIALQQNGKWGYVDIRGNVITPFQFSRVAVAGINNMTPVNIGGTETEDDKFVGGKWGYVNKYGKIVLPVKYNDVGATWTDGGTWIKSEQLYGMIDSTGKIIIIPKYNDIPTARNAYREATGRVFWKLQGKQYVLYHKKTVRLSPKAYDKYGDWNGELAWVMKGEKYGYINRSGKEAIPTVYENLKITYCPEGVYAKQDNKWGLVDWQGKVVVPFQYDIVKDPVYELVHVYYGGTYDKGNDVFRNGKWGLLKQNGQNALTSSYDFMGGEWEDGMLWVNRGGKISPEGNIVGGEIGLIDSTATEVVPLRYTTNKYAREAFKEGMANQFNLRDTIPYYIWNY